MSRAATSRAFVSFGVPFTIVAVRPALDAVAVALPPGTNRIAKAPAGARSYSIEAVTGGWRLVVDNNSLWAGNLRALPSALEGDLALHVAAHAPRHVFIHAGVVAIAGRALVLPGRSMSGKSTLVSRLIAAGALYYSDEYAVLDERGHVVPYARMLSLRRARKPPRRVQPARRGRKPIPVGWVLGTRYEAGAELSLQDISGGRAALLLMDNAVAARLVPTRILPVLRAAVSHARGAMGTRGDATAAAKAILADCV